MRKIFGLVLAVVLSAFVCAGTAHAEPGKIIITLDGWQEPQGGLDLELNASGWVNQGDEVINFKYMNTTGTELEAAQEAMPRLVDLVNQKCFQVAPCELHGYSRGADTLTWIENQQGWPVPGLDVYLHEPANGDTGAMRSPFLNDPSWKPIYDRLAWVMGTANQDVPPPTYGTQVFYNNSSFISNLTPLCDNLALATTMAIQIPIWHSIVMPKEGDYRVWTGSAGAVYHENGNTYPSGADVKSCPPQ